ncbi:MAG TPA: HAMP domain-containing sensor histidine kinase [Longimicrobiales bacterium]|nr:HAMP domain-containing sensor histidine kinase [Longimicrobiales bacterium]
MTVRSRLLLTLAGIILLMMIPAVYGASQLQRLEELAVSLEMDHSDALASIGQIRASLAELDRYQRSHVADPNDRYRSGMRRELVFMANHLELLNRSLGPGATASMAAVRDSLEVATERLVELLEAGLAQQATDYLEQVKPLPDSGRAALNRIEEGVDERGREAVEYAQQVSASAARTTSLAVLVALLLTLGLGLWTVDALSRPLSRLSDATAAVAEGEFSAPENLPYDRSDEIGDLSRSFGAMTGRLAELDRLKAEFVSLASHELKTPINVIAGYAELLEEGLYGDMDPRQREVLALVQDQTKSLTRLVNQLLDLSRFEAGGLRIEPGPVEIRTLLEEVEGSFRALADQKQIDFRVEGREPLPEDAVLDHDRIRHEVLGNLLSNAFKFTSPGGRIRVEAASENGTLSLRVTDSGIGIPKDQLDHIFEKYYQVGDDAKAQGSGLGLAIVKHVVEAHGGTIRATSEVGSGTTFDIDIPSRSPGDAPA